VFILYSHVSSTPHPLSLQLLSRYRKERLEKILEDGEAKRITLRKAARALPKVNRRLAERMLEQGVDAGGAVAGKRKKKKTDRSLEDGEQGGAGASSASSSKGGDGAGGLVDSRFGALFTDSAFEVDEASEQYRLLHPSESSQNYASQPDLLITSDRFNPVESSGESEVEGRGSDGESSSDDDSAYKRGARKPVPERKKKKKKPAAAKEVNMLELNEGESYVLPLCSLVACTVSRLHEGSCIHCAHVSSRRAHSGPLPQSPFLAHLFPPSLPFVSLFLPFCPHAHLSCRFFPPYLPHLIVSVHLDPVPSWLLTRVDPYPSKVQAGDEPS
jgi:hypothetical protein